MTHFRSLGRSVLALGTAWISLIAGPVDMEGQTTVLRGRVVSLTGAPAPQTRLRIVGAGEPVLFDSGEFEQEIPADAETVELTILNDELEVVYPPQGRLPVPGGVVSVVIVVGEPAVRTVTKALAERARRLQKVLDDNSQSLDSLEDAVQEIARLLGVKEEDLRNELFLKEQQAEHYPQIAETVRDYVLQARDLQDALSIVGASTDNAQILRLTVEEALIPYNNAYTRFNNENDGFAGLIEQYWDDGVVRASEFRSFWNGTANRIHELEILPLNEQLAIIQVEVQGGNGNSGKARDARADLLSRVAALDRSLDQLEEEANRVLQALSPS